MIEECGGAVVCMENCTGVKGLDLLVDEEEKDPFLAIARRYLQIPCSCMTPNSRTPGPAPPADQRISVWTQSSTLLCNAVIPIISNPG